MAELCTLEDLREQLRWERFVSVDIGLMRQMWSLRSKIGDVIGDEKHNERILICRSPGQQPLYAGAPGKLITYGSTNAERRTHVMDNSSPNRPFPPDIDGIIVMEDHVMANSALCDKVQQLIVKQITGRRGRLFFVDKHKEYRRNFPLGAVNLSLRMIGEQTAAGMPDLSYPYEDMCISSSGFVSDDKCDVILPSDQDERTETRMLKLLFERNGAYGGFNRGVKGTACEAMVLKYGPVENCFDFLRNTVHAEKRELCHPFYEAHGYKENLFESISHHIWRRIERMLDLYDATGKVKAGSFGIDDWISFAEEKRRDNPRYTVAHFVTTCAPGTLGCGVEPIDIRNAMLKAHPYEKGLDYYLVPYQGDLSTVQPYTEIFAGFSTKPQHSPDDIINIFRENLIAAGGQVRGIPFPQHVH
jgi:hypothetical protein